MYFFIETTFFWRSTISKARFSINYHPLNVSWDKFGSKHQICSTKKAFLRYSGTGVFLWILAKSLRILFTEYLRATPPTVSSSPPNSIWHHLFLEFWLVVDTWFFAHWRHRRAVTCLENVNQLNIRRGKKLGFQLPHRQPSMDSYPPRHNPNPYPDPKPLRWVFSRGIFPEIFAPRATASANWVWLWNFPILFSWN